MGTSARRLLWALVAVVACGPGPVPDEAQPRTPLGFPPTQPPAPTDARLVVSLDGQPLGETTVRATAQGTPLVDHLPAGAPPVEQLAEIRGENIHGRTLRFPQPTARPQPDELRIALYKGKITLGRYLVVPDGASEDERQKAERPAEMVTEPTAIALYTAAPEGEARWPLLRVEIDGDREGRLGQAEALAVARAPAPARATEADPGAPAEGWRLRDLVAARISLDEVAWVELEPKDGEPVRIEAEELTGEASSILHPTQQGTWTLRRYDASGAAPSEVHEDLALLRIERVKDATD